MVEFRGAIDEHAYVRAIRAHGGGIRGLAILFVIAGLLALPSTGPMALALVGFGAALLVLPRLTARRVFRTNKLVRAQATGRLDDESYRAETENGSANIAWSKFHRAAIAPDLILLYLSPRQFLVLPRGFFASDADWAAAQELVRRHVPLRKNRGWLRLVLWVVIIVCVWVLWQLSNHP